MSNLRFLIISLGNQGPYYETFHSAGHHVLNALQRLLPAQPPFTSTRLGKKSPLASLGPKYALVQSPTSMNVSGPWVNATWKQLSQDAGAGPLGLVLVHDELESALGVVRRRDWARSPRGHNGLKSVNKSLRQADYPGAMWGRIGVGIGRPEERDARSVADYVLAPMSKFQKGVVEEKGAAGVLKFLQEMEEEWVAKEGSGGDGA